MIPKMDAFRSNATQTQFLHLTDLHVDPLYSARAGPGSNCHMRLGRSLFVKNPLPVFGLADSGCDAPVTLIEHTLRVLDTKDVDFILWTGDSSRHDRDNNRRKQRLETYEHNRIAVELYTKYIDVSRAPVIPTIGNWDVFPVSALGCSEGDPQLSNLWSVWEPLFPQGDPITETAKSDFLKGGFFKRPVLDGMVSILSLNTLSFFNENPLVSDCAKFDLRDSIENRPWNPMHVADYQMIWTENLLKEARRDGTRVILQGHVSPMGNAVQLWKQECFEWYVYLAGEYSDVILGHYFGHINRDLVHIVSQRHPLSNHKSKEKKKNKKQIDPLSSSQLKNEPSASSSTYNISSTKPHQINPFRLTTLVPNIIKSFDLKNYKIMAAMFTGSSIVPVYNPGYRIGTLTFQPMPALPPSSNSSSFLRPANFTRAEQAATQSKPPSDSNNGWTVSLTKHTTMYLDIAKANKKAMTEPDMELEYIPSCDTMLDYGMPDLSGESLEEWLALMQSAFPKSVGKGGKNPEGAKLLRKYTKCIETSLGVRWDNVTREPVDVGMDDGGEWIREDLVVDGVVVLGLLTVVALWFAVVLWVYWRRRAGKAYWFMCFGRDDGETRPLLG